MAGTDVPLHAVDDPLRAVGLYHVLSKHAIGKFAPGPATMSWETAPSSIRKYAGCACIELPLRSLRLDAMPSFRQALYGDDTTPVGVDLQSLSSLLYHSLALSATKKTAAAEWHLRVAPSSGNLHPTEAFLIVGAELHGALLRESQGGSSSNAAMQAVLHYRADGHLLEERGILTDSFPWAPDSFVVVLSSVHWREAWKYGVRAWRYSVLDAGHAVGAFALAAASLGWECSILEHDGLLADTSILEGLVGLGAHNTRDWAHMPRAEQEDAVVALLICPRQPGSSSSSSDGHGGSMPPSLDLLRRMAYGATWRGAPSLLSEQGGHVEYPAMVQVARATSVPADEATAVPRRSSLSSVPSVAPTPRLPAAIAALPAPRGRESVSSIVRGRRSAHKFDPQAPPLGVEGFYAILAATIPTLPDGASANGAIWRAPAPARQIRTSGSGGIGAPEPGWGLIHLLVFVHSVDGLEPGLYALDRGATPSSFAALRERMHAAFAWPPASSLPGGCPEVLAHRLYGPLHGGDVRGVAGQLACDQGELAADGHLSIAMVGDLATALQDPRATWDYRRLHLEAGMIGHTLYLEAEAQAIRGSGLGCFFDDEVPKLVGLPDARFQSLYHFAVGAPVSDDRLQADLDPYAALIAQGR